MDLTNFTFAYRLLVWLFIASVIGIYSYKLKFLDLGGLVTAMVIGTSIFISGGLQWIAPLALFFLLSSILTRLAENHQRGKKVKHSARTAKQVFANGGMAAIAALGYLLFPYAGFQLFFLGSLAAVTSDTWSTEIGSFSESEPLMITNFKKVKKGVSGGISLIGTLGGISGAFLLGLAGSVIFTGNAGSEYYYTEFQIVILGGLFGNLVDSLVGALLQSKFRCKVCGKITESRIHCNVPTILSSGIGFIDNEAVNISCAISGGAFSYITWLWIK